MVTVHVGRASGTAGKGVLHLTRADAEQLDVGDGDRAVLDIGKWSSSVRVQVGERDGSILIPPPLAPGLPVRSLALYRVSGGRLRLGPLIGILITYRVTSKGPRGSQMSTYVELMRRARQTGALAFVMRSSTLTRGTTVTGWTKVNGKWVRCRLPYPDVVYNRINSRPVERRIAQRGGFRRLERKGVAVFNPHYLNKWGVHRLLMHDENVRRYLPETRRYRRISDVSDVLSRHGLVFLKPAAGSLGLGAILVSRSQGRLRYKMNTMSGRRKEGNLPRTAALRRVMPRRNDYLVQQGIRLARVQGRSFDVRALVQKDVTGDWLLTGAAARIAGRGRITTHVPRGGSRRDLAPVLREVFGPHRVDEIRAELEHACVSAGQALERLSGKPFGEFSLDVAIDVDGKIWILEMNAKPFRFDERPLRRLAQRRLVRLATHLAGCPVDPEEDRALAMATSKH